MMIDPAAAARAYVDTLGAAELATARAYTLGDHWLLLGTLVVAAVVTWLIVRTGALERVHLRLRRRGWAMRTLLVAATFLVIDALLTLPWTLYSDWWRERDYGHSSQPLGDFLVQGGISLLVTALVGALFLLGLYALLRRTGRWWWAWGGALVAAGLAFMLLLSPVLIEPLFNDYRPVPQGEVRDAVLALAADADIPPERVLVFDGSRQSNNFTANVSGVGPFARIAISDVALRDASLDEVRAVTGHEIGHYVLGHVWRLIAVFSLLALVVLALTAKLYPWFARAFGTGAKIEDIRGVPVLLFVVTLLTTLASPITNSLTRIGESEADAYSLEHVGLPDALSAALLKTAEYRYPRPGAVEEALFYTHPSVERRIERAMEAKAAAGQ